MRASMTIIALAFLALCGGVAVAQAAPAASAAPAVQSADAGAQPALSARDRAKAEKKAAKARQQAAAASDPDRIICKRTQTQDDAEEGGSRLGGQRTCLTRAQWADRANEDQKMLTEMRHMGVSGH